MELIKLYGLNMNGVTLLVAISFLPELSLGRRLLLLTVTIVLMAISAFFHRRQTKHRIWTDTTIRSVWLAEKRTLISSTVVGIASIAVGLLGLWLSGSS
jgi:putative copper export protein